MLIGFNIYGKTVGVVGKGKIGEVFSRIMFGFGARVIADDVMANAELIKEGAEYTTPEELMEHSDLISQCADYGAPGFLYP
jgi:D-lactate dehydrogenase